MTTETTRAALHEALAAVPGEELWRVAYFLEYLRTGDAMLRSLCLAPYDDGPVPPEEEAAVQEGLDAYRRGDVRSLEDVKRELGL